MYLECKEEFDNYVTQTVNQFIKKSTSHFIIPWLTPKDYYQEASLGVYYSLKKLRISIHYPVYILKTFDMFIKFCARQSILNLNQLYFTQKRKIECQDNSILDMDCKFTVSFKYMPDDKLRLREYISEVTDYVSSDEYLSRLWLLVRVLNVKTNFKDICFLLNKHVPIKIGYDLLSIKINELKKICYSLVDIRKQIPYFPPQTTFTTHQIYKTDNDNLLTTPPKEQRKKQYYLGKEKSKKIIENYFNSLSKGDQHNG